MSIKFHWFLPTTGDSRTLVGGGHGIPTGIGRPVGGKETANSFREPDFDYLSQVARTAEYLGYEAVLTPAGTWCEDAWITTSALIAETERLKFLVAFRPGLLSPTLAAQMAATFQHTSKGRLLINVVAGGESADQIRYGDHLTHAERYARTDEFLTVVRGAWTGEGFDFKGDYYDIEDARTRRPPETVPDIYFGGSSAPALEVAAKHVDTYLTWGEPPSAVAEKLDRLRTLAKEQGRTLRFGIRLHVITRDTSEEAWAEAARLLAGIDPAEVEKAQTHLAKSESEGQRRMRELHGGGTADLDDVRSLEVSPGLWAGVGLLRAGAGTALVGSHSEVAELIEEYHALGIDEFILSGYPHIEEAYWFAEGVKPVLRCKGILT